MKNYFDESWIIESVLIDPTATVEKYCQIGPNVIIGKNVKIESGCRIWNAAIMKNSTIKGNCFIKEIIIA